MIKLKIRNGTMEIWDEGAKVATVEAVASKSGAITLDTHIHIMNSVVVDKRDIVNTVVANEEIVGLRL